MPKARLANIGDRTTEAGLLKAVQAGLVKWRPDLRMPESTSDLEACVREIMRRYDVVKRSSPRDLALDMES